MSRPCQPLCGCTTRIATVLLLAALALPWACHEKKRNANDDLRKHKDSVMDQMDKLAAEEDSKPKPAAPSPPAPGTPPAPGAERPSSPDPASPPPPPPPAPPAAPPPG